MALTTVTGNMVSVNAIQGTLIADNAITAVHIASNAVTSIQIAENNVTAREIASNSITVAQLADASVESDKIADGVITTNHLNSAMISSQTEVTAVAGDFVLLGDTSDSNNLKKAPVSSLAPNALPLAGGTMTGTIAGFTSTGIDDNATSTAITIDSSENVLMGQTSGDSADTGHIFNPIGVAFHIRDSGVPLVVKRNTNDGELIQLKKDGTTVGSIGSRSGVVSYIVLDPRSGVKGAALIGGSVDANNGIINPGKADGDAADAAISLGSASYRFKDLYLSGSANVGSVSATGNITANGVTIGASDVRSSSNVLTLGGTSERLRIDSSGNVGIGTTNPTEKLHVNSGTGNVPALFQSSDALALITFKDNNTSTDVGVGASGNDQVFYAGSERMRIAANNLHLNGGTDARIQLGTGGAGANQVSNNTVHIRGDGADMKLMTASGGIYQFEQNGTNRLVFGTNDWYLGAFNNSTETLNFRTSNNGTTKFNFYDNNSTEGLYIKHTGQTYGGKIIYGARWDDDEDWMAIDLTQSSSGGGYDCRVGIGTTSPAVPLVIQVSASQNNAEMRFQSGTYATDHFKLYANQSGRFYVQNVSTSNAVHLAYNATSWTSGSDERLKENIVELDNVLPKISNLRAVKYNFISDEENTTKIGFIAQDWQTDFSEVVSDSIPEELGINYTETIPVLLKAIQEQQTIIEDLKARLTAGGL